jgi:hypothetical protein
MMSTIAVSGSSTFAPRSFHFGMSLVFLAVGVIGFAPSYWLPLFSGTLRLAPIVHFHALFFYGWLLLYARQAWLVSEGRVASHRELGIAGVSLATSMFFIGITAAVNSMRDGIARGIGDQVRAFSIVPVSGILLFALFFAAAIVYARKPDIHRRLMLVNTVGLLQAAIGRWFALLLAGKSVTPEGGFAAPPPVAATISSGLVGDLLIVAAMIHDRRTRGRVHPAYWIAGAIVLASQILRAPASTTPAWLAVADAILAFFP